MNPENAPIPGAPIIEAVVDIDCDLPPDLEITSLAEAAGEALRDDYPKFRKKLLQEHIFTKKGEDPPEIKVNEGLGALQFISSDDKQLIQFRPNGFSFNRLAPYHSMNDYFAEIERGWQLFLKLANPIVVRKLSIRMINRIPLPIIDDRLELQNFLKIYPKLPETGSPLSLLGFLDQHRALDNETGNHVNIVKTTENPRDGKLPLILDIEAFYPCQLDPNDWKPLRDRLDSLRSLKNRIFRNTIITDQCLNPS